MSTVERGRASDLVAALSKARFESLVEATVEVCGVEMASLLPDNRERREREVEVVETWKGNQGLDALEARVRGIWPGHPLLPATDVGIARRTLIESYLADALLQHERVRVVGFDDRYKVRLGLDDVFVDLNVQVGRLPGDEADKLDLKRMGHPESREADLRGALKLSEDRAVTSGLVLLGDPGAGKTTLLKWLLCRVAQHGSAWAGLSEGLVPVLIRASAVQGKDRARKRRLPSMIARELTEQGWPDAAEALEAGLRDRSLRVLLLLDGIDEVRDEPTRVKVCRWLEEELDHWPGSRVVATCRFAAWRRDAVLSADFLPADILWLDDDGIEKFVTQWYRAVQRALGRHAVDGEQRSAELVAALSTPKRHSDIRLREISSNPLLLSQLCLVHHAGHALPERRAHLYRACLGLLLETWAKVRDLKGLQPDAAMVVLAPLAWVMHDREVRTLSGAEVRPVIEEPLDEVQGIELGPDEFLARVRDECGVLVGRDLDSYEFFHLSFQEYLAALHAQADGLHAELAKRLDRPFWRETILLSMTLPGMFAPVMREVLKRKGLATHRELLRECLQDAIAVEGKPFAEAMRRYGDGGGALNTEDVVALLTLFEGRKVPRAVEEVAADWVQRSREADGARRTDAVEEVVLVAARAMLGLPPRTTGAGGKRPPQDGRSATVPGRTRALPTDPAPGEQWREPVTGAELLWVPPGTFWMGSTNKKRGGVFGLGAKEGRNYDLEAVDAECPAHEVTLTNGFWIGRHPVTNAEYGRFLEASGREPPQHWSNRKFNGAGQPVVTVSWEEARAFCDWLSAAGSEGGDARFGLPSEAEWEWAARGPEARRYPWGDPSPTPELAAFAQKWADGSTVAVGGRPSGASWVGAEDLAGNVWEWCLDHWRDDYSQDANGVVDPCHQSDSLAAHRVVRGGCWDNVPRLLRSACRYRRVPEDRNDNLGFRLVCRVPRQLGS